MGDAVGGGKGRLGKVRVMEFNLIGEQQGLGGAVYDVKSVVVVEGVDDFETIIVSKFPSLMSVGIVVDEEFVSNGGNWCGVVVMGASEVLPGGDGWIQFGLAE